MELVGKKKDKIMSFSFLFKEEGKAVESVVALDLKPDPDKQKKKKKKKKKITKL